MDNNRKWQKLLVRADLHWGQTQTCPVVQQGAFALLWETFINIQLVPVIWGEQPGQNKCSMLPGSHKIYNHGFVHARWSLYTRAVATWHLQHRRREYPVCIWDFYKNMPLLLCPEAVCDLIKRMMFKEENTVRVLYDVFLISWTQRTIVLNSTRRSLNVKTAQFHKVLTERARLCLKAHECKSQRIW